MPVRTDVRDRDGRPEDFQGLVGGPAVRALAKTHGLRGRSTAELVSARSRRAPRPSSRSWPTAIAVGIAVIIAVADPAVVVLGGSVGTRRRRHARRPRRRGHREGQPAPRPGHPLVAWDPAPLAAERGT